MIKIEKADFLIESDNIEPLLKELKLKYPDVVGLDYEFPVSNLQYLLYILGLHSRINIDGSLFTLSMLHEGSKIPGVNPIEVMRTLLQYATDDSYIMVDANGIKDILANRVLSLNEEIDKFISTIENNLIAEVSNVEVKEVNNDVTEIVESVKKKRGRPKKNKEN